MWRTHLSTNHPTWIGTMFTLGDNIILTIVLSTSHDDWKNILCQSVDMVWIKLNKEDLPVPWQTFLSTDRNSRWTKQIYQTHVMSKVHDDLSRMQLLEWLLVGFLHLISEHSIAFQFHQPYVDWVIIRYNLIPPKICYSLRK